MHMHAVIYETIMLTSYICSLIIAIALFLLQVHTITIYMYLAIRYSYPIMGMIIT